MDFSKINEKYNVKDAQARSDIKNINNNLKSMYQEATANPLRKQYFDRGGDNEKLDLTKDDDTDGL